MVSDDGEESDDVLVADVRSPSPVEESLVQRRDRSIRALAPSVATAVLRCSNWMRKQLASRKDPSAGAKFSSHRSLCPLCSASFEAGDVMVLSYLSSASPSEPSWVHVACVRALHESRGSRF